jgi:amidase
MCPIARTVGEVALALEVLAGDDPRDPQWVRGPIKVDRYTRALGKDVSGMKIGIIKEAFSLAVSEPDVDQAVRDAVKGLEAQGVSSQDVSLPMFREARAIWTALTAHSVAAMVESDGEGYWRGGWCNIGWQETFGRARRLRGHDFPPLLKMVAIEARYMMQSYFSTYYSKAQNLRMAFREEVDRLLKEYDALALPTIPMKPVKLLTEPLGLQAMGSRIASISRNTLPFNLTGHPAISVPCGPKGSLPIGLQLVGRHWQESALFRLAHAVERQDR